MFFSKDKTHLTISKQERRQIRDILCSQVLLILPLSVTFYKKTGATAFILSLETFYLCCWQIIYCWRKEMYYVHNMHCKYLIHKIYVCMHAQSKMLLKYFTKASDTV